jgi:hypothetical protein
MLDMLDIHLLAGGINDNQLEETLQWLNACTKSTTDVGYTKKNVQQTNTTNTVTDTSELQ